ncbi:FecR family protein [Chitinophaga arvensicola]|uniref:FecR protein n=1 Tax=Chitinophaga arvensicola TaxID=29529 RepID=A0A1I0REY8_9BACT|nr:FecR family protein [Chitinophaga arvensicola]SEW39435.1 FecR protein [Chitinophaga arvensicola]
MEAKEYYRFLLERYYNGTATAAEEEELFAALRTGNDDEAWTSLISELHSHAAPDPAYNPALFEPQLNSILQKQPTTVRPLYFRYAAAAAIALLIGAAGYFAWHRTVKPAPAVMAAADVKPGKNGAVLTLADGSQLVLDSLGNGVVTTQQGTRVTLSNGQLSYDATGAGTLSYNTMTTPRGRKFRLRLPDGTNVWLNAASSISFPTAFTGAQRNVKLTGEAYFEVAANPKQPFTVTLNNNTRINVLGTHFNINAYPEEANIGTTLMSGAVQVSQQQQTHLLHPGQQLEVNRETGAALLHSDVDTLAIIAWKNDVLNFQDKKLTTVISMIARWYDIEVVYETTPPDITFVGEIGSDVNLSSVLTFLKESGIHFRLEDKKLIVGK